MENTKKCKMTENDSGKEKKSLIGDEEEREEEENGLQAEAFSDEFQCCICLDLLYKPVVLGCGHLSCFWCVHKAMNICYESHCPICRHPYNHFPSICELLHLLLLKVYPVAYESRERQVTEEEKKMGYFSPAIHKLFGSCPSKELDIHQSSHANLQAKSYLEDHVGKGESSSIGNSSDLTMHQPDGSSLRSKRVSNGTEIAANGIIQKGNLLGNDVDHGAHNQVTVSDFPCAACKMLLFRPVVLNCGHVYCESCICGLESEIIKCEVCQCLHPNGLPSVCLTIEHFLEEQFSDIYAERRETLLKLRDGSGQTQGETARSLSDVYSSWWWGNNGPKVHIGVGCDSCGMSPLIGERYKCKDCTEEIGFDLCEECHRNPTNIPGRFNQQHKPEHEFEILSPKIPSGLFRRLTSAQPGQLILSGPDSPDNMGDALRAPILSFEVQQVTEDGSHDVEDGSALVLSIDIPEDLQHDSDDSVSQI